MYLRIGLVLALLGALYSVAQLPDYYRNQGAEKERVTSKKGLEKTVEEAVNKEKLKNLTDKLNYEIKYQEVRNDYAKELELTRASAARSGGLLFNKERICANTGTRESKDESGSGIDAGTSNQELLPEPYATNIKELMLQADLEMDKVRALQRVIKESPCMIVVSDKAKE